MVPPDGFDSATVSYRYGLTAFLRLFRGLVSVLLSQARRISENHNMKKISRLFPQVIETYSDLIVAITESLCIRQERPCNRDNNEHSHI